MGLRRTLGMLTYVATSAWRNSTVTLKSLNYDYRDGDFQVPCPHSHPPKNRYGGKNLLRYARSAAIYWTLRAPDLSKSAALIAATAKWKSERNPWAGQDPLRNAHPSSRREAAGITQIKTRKGGEKILSKTWKQLHNSSDFRLQRSIYFRHGRVNASEKNYGCGCGWWWGGAWIVLGGPGFRIAGFLRMLPGVSCRVDWQLHWRLFPGERSSLFFRPSESLS